MRLLRLATGTKRGPRPTEDRRAVKRRVTRKDGIADSVASCIVEVLDEINDNLKLEKFPLTQRHLIERLPEGKKIISAANNSAQTRTLAKKALEIFQVAGPACRGGVLGVLAAEDSDDNTEGKVTTKELAKLTGLARPP